MVDGATGGAALRRLAAVAADGAEGSDAAAAEVVATVFRQAAKT